MTEFTMIEVTKYHLAFRDEAGRVIKRLDCSAEKQLHLHAIAAVEAPQGSVTASVWELTEVNHVQELVLDDKKVAAQASLTKRIRERAAADFTAFGAPELVENGKDPLHVVQK